MKTGSIKIDYIYSKLNIDDFSKVIEKGIEDFGNGYPMFEDDSIEEDFVERCFRYLYKFNIYLTDRDEERGWVEFEDNGIKYFAVLFGISLEDEIEDNLVCVYSNNFELYRRDI